jgi:hypothetical protein
LPEVATRFTFSETANYRAGQNDDKINDLIANGMPKMKQNKRRGYD